ncbi:nuclease-related domain-containing DEAD/DEAH box helicase [Pseudomonas sp. R32]|uniref:nuclease-related domain-containing DEAD/DEAH box helicase n=1 Tax=Pseudomonas sp. R32 TaxID=1573704 RepID=UPI00132F1D74|nr:DNA/RNA helicase domain-containing protein [Pseudomonas sp. R32]QHF29307.1 nuclease [Pseudomonas sp. R32]
MAILIPEKPKDCTYSERVFYERLGRELDSEWIILHSLGLHGHESKIWGEADIVILSTKGFFSLEVKGGRVSCKDGVWQFGDPSRKSYSKKEDPWTQSKGTMFAVRKLLNQIDSRFKDLLIGFGVVMPGERFTATGAEIEPAVLLDKREFSKDLGFYIGKLERHWISAYESKHGRKPRLPSKEDIQIARRILRPDVASTFSLGSYLTGIDAKLVELTNDQIRVSRRMAANPRTVVRGQAGTGKTVIAMERARQLAAQGKRVLFLCFNQLLAKHLRLTLEGEAVANRIEIRHVHALYKEVIDRAGLSKLLEQASDEYHLFAEVFPSAFLEAAIECELPAWDALVVDEAQDLLTPENLDAFDYMLGAPGLNCGHWHFFFDRLQNIYGVEVQGMVERRLSEAQPAYDDLFENCRNTKQVAVQGSIISGIDLAIIGAPEGLATENTYYRDKNDFVARLSGLITMLVAQDISPGDIAILSTRRREHSSISGLASIGGQDLVDVSVSNAGDMVFSTMHAFKGLERRVVIAIDMDEIGQATRSMLHYAGLSRAKTLLYVFLPEITKATYSTQASSYAQRLIGSL